MILAVEALFKENCIYSTTVPSFFVDGCSVLITGTGNDIRAIIEKTSASNETLNTLWKTFSIVWDLLFLAIGAYPELVAVEIDSSPIDISKLIYKYKSAREFQLSYFQFASLDSNIFNATMFYKLKVLNRKPLFSLQYLVSEKYSCIMTVHKTALLLQAAEGIYHSVTPKDSESKFDNVLTAVFKEFFSFEAANQILTQLGNTHDSFFEVLKHTRDDATHYFEEVDKFRNKRLKTASLDRIPEWGTGFMWEYMYCTYIAIRLYLADYLGFLLNTDNVDESLSAVHDWIYANSCERDGIQVDCRHYKSKTYMGYHIKSIAAEAIKGNAE